MSSQHARARILLVDDSPPNIQILNSILQSDYQVFFATSGAKALEMARDKDIDLILLDVLMPEMDGFEVCHRLKQDRVTQDIPVIFVTAMFESEDEVRGFEAGGVDYLVKPVSAPTVKARVRTHLELKRQRDALRRLSSQDILTGLPNKSQFEHVLASEWQRALANGTSLSVLLLNPDAFSSFNELYGARSADHCLQLLAELLGEACDPARRPGTLLARLEGASFGYVIPESSEDAARSLAGECLQMADDLNLQHAGSPVSRHVTLSIGGVTLRPGDGGTPDECMDAARASLAAAHTAGGNRFELGAAED